MKDFSGHVAKRVVRTKIKEPKAALAFGELKHIDYTTKRDGKIEDYRHKFRKKSRPALAASADGKQLFIVGGNYEFTEAGIEDR